MMVKRKNRTKRSKATALNRLVILLIRMRAMGVGSWPTMIQWEKKFVYKFPKEFL